MPFFKTLAGRFFLLLSIAGILPIILVLFIVFREVRNEEQKTVQKYLRKGRMVRMQVEEEISAVQNLLISLSFLPSYHPHFFSFCPTFLKKILNQFPRYLNIGFIDSEGFLLCSALPAKKGLYLGDRLYFRDALKGGFAIGSYQIGRITGKPSVNLGYPVIWGEKITGVVFLALGIGFFHTILDSYPVEEELLFITDREGNLLAGSSPEGEVLQLFRKREPPPWKKLGEEMIFSLPLSTGTLYHFPSGWRVPYGSLQIYLFLPRSIFTRIFWEKGVLFGSLFLIFFLFLFFLYWKFVDREVLEPFRSLLPLLKGEKGVKKGSFPEEIQEIRERIISLMDSLRKAKEEVEIERDRYFTLLDLAPVAIAVHQDGKIVYANQEALKLVRAKKREEVVGKAVLDFVHPDSLPEVKERIARMLRGEPSVERLEEKFLRVDGTVAEVEVVATRIFYDKRIAILVMVLDLSEVREKERKLREAMEELDLALSGAKMGVVKGDLERRFFSLDANGGELFTGERMEKTLTEEEFLSLIYPEDHSAIYSCLEKAKEGGVCQVEFRLQRDPSRWIGVNARFFPGDDDKVEVVGILQEITLQKKASLLLMEEKEKAEEISKLKSLFLAQMSHEIRTPLTMILGYAELLKKQIPSGGEELVERILSGGRRLTRLFNNIIEFARVEGGALRFHPVQVELLPLLEKVGDFLSPLAKEKGLFLKVDLTRNETVVGDPFLIEQILLNLIHNAIQYTEEGEVTVRIERVSEKEVGIVVSDTGPGIPESFLPHLFEPFRQVENRGYKKSTGSGLGLAISYRLATLMGGRIVVDTRPQEGSTFTLLLPTS